MRKDLVLSLRAGTVRTLHRDLQDKVWSEEELADADVLRVPGGAGVQRGITRQVQSGGRIVLSPVQYAYQGTVPDRDTGIVHVLGYQTGEPEGWRWVMIHPSSLERQVQRRVEQLEEMKRQAVR